MKLVQRNSEDTLSIRHQVLWPNELPEYCRVVGDNNALHFGVTINDELISVASIYINDSTARLRKFATLKKFQEKGAGSFLLNHIIKTLKRIKISYFWFDARESAVGFYNRLGFISTGELFYKNKVAFCKMYTTL